MVCYPFIFNPERKSEKEEELWLLGLSTPLLLLLAMGIAAHWCGSLVGKLGQWQRGFSFNPAREHTATPHCRAAPAQPGSGHVSLSSSSASVFALSARLGGFSQKGLSGPSTLCPSSAPPWVAENASCLHWSSICKPHLRCRAGWAFLHGGDFFSCSNVGCLVLHETLRVGHSHSCILSTLFFFFLPLVSTPRHNTAWALLLIHCIIFPLEYQTTKTAYRKSWHNYSHLSKGSHYSMW